MAQPHDKKKMVQPKYKKWSEREIKKMFLTEKKSKFSKNSIKIRINFLDF